MPKKKIRGLESIKSRYGRLFILPWQIGILFFVLLPLLSSINYSLSDISTSEIGLETTFVGLKNYLYIFKNDPYFIDYLSKSFNELLYSLPSIIVISMILGIVLNGKFKGRLLFRSVYFLPVIIASGVVLQWIQGASSTSITEAGIAQGETTNMIDVSDIMALIGIEGTFVEYFQLAISKIFDIVWASGIQIVLFISGLQSIPDSLYEVSKVEGATKWEEFWFVTFPMLSRVTVLVIIYTIVDLMTDKTNVVMGYIYSLMSTLNYNESSAMLWSYILISSGLMGIVIFAFKKFCSNKWE